MKLITATEAADFLQVKGDTLYSLIEKDELPAAKVVDNGDFLKKTLSPGLKQNIR